MIATVSSDWSIIRRFRICFAFFRDQSLTYSGARPVIFRNASR
jgi:hypothetical protein